MRPDEFDGIMTRLRNCFGDRHFGRERSERIYKFCLHLTVDQFDKLVDGLIDGSRNPPLPYDFVELMQNRGISIRAEKLPDYLLLLQCGHKVGAQDYKTNPVCPMCEGGFV